MLSVSIEFVAILGKYRPCFGKSITPPFDTLLLNKLWRGKSMAPVNLSYAVRIDR